MLAPLHNYAVAIVYRCSFSYHWVNAVHDNSGANSNQCAYETRIALLRPDTNSSLCILGALSVSVVQFFPRPPSTHDQPSSLRPQKHPAIQVRLQHPVGVDLLLQRQELLHALLAEVGRHTVVRERKVLRKVEATTRLNHQLL